MLSYKVIQNLAVCPEALASFQPTGRTKCIFLYDQDTEERREAKVCADLEQRWAE
jgi:hypothetical protein